MPHTDGFSLIAKIRETDMLTPIVIMRPLTSKKLKDAISLSMRKLRSLDRIVDLGNGFILNKERSNLYKNGIRVPLTKNEAKLLRILVDNIDIPLLLRLLHTNHKRAF